MELLEQESIREKNLIKRFQNMGWLMLLMSISSVFWLIMVFAVYYLVPYLSEMLF